MPVRRRRGRAYAQAFGEALRLVAQDYAGFVRRMSQPGPDEDPKAFGTRHAAAKACLAHLEQLLDLIGEDGGVEQVRDGFALLHEARQVLDLPVPDEEDPPHDGPGEG
jgi:hypothetical protein